MYVTNSRVGVRTSALLLGALLTLWILAGCSREEPVSFAAVLSLSGTSGVPAVGHGMDLAVDEVNDTGGINGREIRLHVADSEGNAELGAQQTAALIEEHDPLLVFSTLSSVTKAVSEEAERREIPLIGLVATDPSIPRGKEWTYVFYPSAEHETEPIFSLLRRRDARTVGIIHNDDAYGRSVVTDLERRAQGSPLTIDSVPYSRNADELAAAVRTLAGHDALYLVGFSSQLLAMHAELSAQAYEGMVLGTSTITLPSLRQENDLSGVFAAAPLLYNDAFVFAQKVSDRYEERYEQPLNHYAATGYDIIKIVAGILNGEDLTRDGVIRVLERGFIYPGVFGEIRLAQGENNIFFPLHAARIKDGDLDYAP